MSVSRQFATTLIAALAFTGGAFAMEPMMLKEGQAVLVMPDGNSMMMEGSGDKAMMDMAMKTATPVTEGMIFFMQGGKMMMTKDSKMDDGKMMSDAMMSMK